MQDQRLATNATSHPKSKKMKVTKLDAQHKGKNLVDHILLVVCNASSQK
jgi:hypothetical protein